ncbi:hypothetical protein ACFQX4_20740 [Roseomonas sp. GCM10028921]
MPADLNSATETPEANAAGARSRGAAEGGTLPPYARAPDGTWFTVDPVFLGAAAVAPYERKPDDPVYRPLRIYALDPSASRLDGAVATVNLPYEKLEPGPRGAVLAVVDYDGTTETIHPPLDLNDPKALIRDGRDPSVSDLQFHQQMSYAVCTSTYHAFRNALGRDPSWGFEARPGEDCPILRIRPHAFREENAFYLPDCGELCFGYYEARQVVSGRNLPFGRVDTCLSHDIVVHEMTHALLDGMRRHFLFRTNPDVAAFHEGFADLVAIFTRFSYGDMVRAAILRSDGNPGRDTLLFSVAQQFGQTTGQQGPLRSAIDAEDAAGGRLRLYRGAGEEPHGLGTVLVSAVFEAFNTVFSRKSARYRRLARHAPQGSPDSELVEILANQARDLAQQFLSICIRAVDYCPPIDLRFGEYLRAMITADHDLVPDDPLAYREALIDAFARRGIYPDDVPSLSEASLLWCKPQLDLPAIEQLHFARLRFAGDPGRAADAVELRRQAEALGAYVMRPRIAREFGCALPGDPDLQGDAVDPAEVCSVRSLRRIGPDKSVAFDQVAEIVQRRWLSMPAGPPVEFLGGATAVIGADGRVRYVIRKSVTDPVRAAAQRDLARTGKAGIEARGGRLRLRQASLRELHRRNAAGDETGQGPGNRARRHKDDSR